VHGYEQDKVSIPPLLMGDITEDVKPTGWLQSQYTP